MITIDTISRDIANRIIRENHYSKSICFAPSVNLGIFWKGMLCGVAQFGSGINPKGSTKWVDGSTHHQFLEFNRMWLSDVAPHNSESKAIGLIFNGLERIDLTSSGCYRLQMVQMAKLVPYIRQPIGSILDMIDKAVFGSLQMAPE